MTGGGPREGGPRLSQGASKRVAEDEPEQQNQRNTKRSRVTRACDQCRATRERCDGVKPTCGTCSSQNRECGWEEKPKRRGITPNYIRTLELTLAWIFDNINESEFLLSNNLPVSGSTCFRLIGAKDVGATEVLHQRWRNGVVSRQIEQLLSNSPVEPGLTSRPPERRSHHRRQHRNSSSSRSSGSNPSEDARSTSRDTSDNPDSSLAPASSEETLTLPEDTWTLLEYYFAFTHSWLPFISKSDTLKLVYSFPAEGLSSKRDIPPEYARLWSILAVSEAQMNFHGNHRPPTKILEVAKKLIPFEHSLLKLEHFDCFLLLALVELTRGGALSAWVFLGLALRLLAYPHGMNKASSSPQWAQIQRSRFAVHIIETALANRLQTIPQSTLDQTTQSSLVSEEGDEEWAPWRDPLQESTLGLAKSPSRSFSTFNQLIRLALQGQNPNLIDNVGASSRLCEVVFTLINNPTRQHGRKQPSSIVSDFWLKPIFTPPPAPSERSRSLSSSSTEQNRIAQTQMQASEQRDIHHHASISIPHDLDYSPEDAGEMLSGQSLQPQPNNPSDERSKLTLAIGASKKTGGTANDLFEELASIENAEQDNADQFMNNLGFGPELDLLEFFGSDYLPSDPFLAQMQSSMKLPNGARVSKKQE